MTLASDFSPWNINPAVLFGLELDSGESNFWSGPYPVEAGGKTYIALPGIDGGISIQQSLEIEDLSGDIQLTGTTPEILALALTEDFQNRPARIHLASLDGAGQVSAVELAFSGLIDDIRIQEGPDNPSLEIIIRGTFSDLEAAREAEPPIGR